MTGLASGPSTAAVGQGLDERHETELLRLLERWQLPVAAPGRTDPTAGAGIWRRSGGLAEAGARAMLLAVKEMPIVLAVILVLFLTSEVWQFFGRIEGFRYAAVFALFLSCAAMVVWFGHLGRRRRADRFLLPGEREDQPAFARRIEAAAGGTPAAPLIGTAPPEYPGKRAPARARMQARRSLMLGLCFETAAVGLLVFLVFVVFGGIAIDEELTRIWVERSPAEELEISEPLSALGGRFLITEPLLRVAGLLAAFAILTFAVETVVDDRLREELVEEKIRPYERALAAWACYRAAAEPLRRVS